MTDAITTEQVDFLGEKFHIAEKVSDLALMRFAKVAQTGTDANEMAGLAAMYDILEQCVHPAEWNRFQSHADKQRADGEQLMAVVEEVFEAIALRPTGRSSGSSDGPQTIEPSSTDDSFSAAERVIQRLNDQGRPDLALVVRSREESLTA